MRKPVFAIEIVQSLYLLNPKFQASNHLLWLYSPVCVGIPEDRFSHDAAQLIRLPSRLTLICVHEGKLCILRTKRQICLLFPSANSVEKTADHRINIYRTV